MMKDNTYVKSQNALSQVVTRGGKPIVICGEGEDFSGLKGLPTIHIPQIVDCLQVV